jgi:hypothetical protein
MPGNGLVAGIYGLISAAGFVGGIGTAVRGDVVFPVLVLGSAVFIGVLAGRAWRGGVFDAGDALVAQSEMSTVRVDWQEVEHFEYRGMKGLGLWTKDGKWVHLQYASRKDIIARTLDLLDAELRRRSPTSWAVHEAKGRDDMLAPGSRSRWAVVVVGLAVIYGVALFISATGDGGAASVKHVALIVTVLSLVVAGVGWILERGKAPK